MKILLVFPKIPMNSDNLRPPLGLAYLAAMLEKKHDVKIVDLNLEDVDEFDYDLIGVSVLTPMYNSAKKFVKKVREKNKEVSIVFGGPHPTVHVDLCFEENDINFVIRGEAEETIVELADNLKDFSNVKGISYKKDKVIHNADRVPIQDLDLIPFPARHLLRMEKYASSTGSEKQTTLITSRGCPFNCTYCCKISGNKWRARSAKNIVDEIKELIEKYDINSFYFNDDLFTFKRERVVEICNELLDLKVKWRCMSRVNTIDEELLRLMKRAGCVNINYGIESGNADTLLKIKKGVTLEQAERALKLTKKVGIYSTTYFMIGFPWEDEAMIKKTVDFAKKLNSDETFFFVVMPYPGTELWDYGVQKGYLEEEDLNWDEFCGITSDFKEKVFFTNRISPQRLLELRKKAYKAVIIKHFMTKIKEGDFKYLVKQVKQKKIKRIFRFAKNLLKSS